MPTKNLVLESHRALYNGFLAESSNGSWLKSPKRSKSPQICVSALEMGNQPPASGSVGTTSATRWQCCRTRGPCSCRGDWRGEPWSEAAGGEPSARTGVSRAGCRCPHRGIPRDLPPDSGMLSSVSLKFQDDSAQHRINSELNLRKKGLRVFWLCFSPPRLPKAVLRSSFTYDRGSRHSPWGQCGEDVSISLCSLWVLFWVILSVRSYNGALLCFGEGR